jgi:hypothetical protein
MCFPFDENATDQTESVCPVNGPATISPVVASHTQIVLSSEPETICWPSGENATDQTESVCPVRGPVLRLVGRSVQRARGGVILKSTTNSGGLL